MTAATRWPEAHASRGLVATPHALASEAGLAVLARGGNAVDAAIAAGAAIAVVYPHMNGVGGDSFWLIYDGRQRALRALNAAGRSAAAADLERYRARFGAAIPVRGGVAALTRARRRLGLVGGPRAEPRLAGARRSPGARFSRRRSHHARDGFPRRPAKRRETADATDLFGDATPADLRESLWPVFHPELLKRERLRPGGSGVDPGGDRPERERRVLSRRARSPPRPGRERRRQPLTADDLARHQPEWVEPLRVPYRGGEATSFPPPTQGFAALAILSLLEGFEIKSLAEADYVHIVVEATKLAFEDRDRYLADPTVASVPVAQLPRSGAPRRAPPANLATGRDAGGRTGREGRHDRHRHRGRAGERGVTDPEPLLGIRLGRDRRRHRRPPSEPGRVLLARSGARELPGAAQADGAHA